MTYPFSRSRRGAEYRRRDRRPRNPHRSGLTPLPHPWPEQKPQLRAVKAQPADPARCAPNPRRGLIRWLRVVLDPPPATAVSTWALQPHKHRGACVPPLHCQPPVRPQGAPPVELRRVTKEVVLACPGKQPRGAFGLLIYRFSG
jgi:hypothetical protein